MDLLVFDIDYTLTQTAKIYQDIFAEGLKELGVKKKSHKFNSYKHHTDSYIAKEIYESEIKSNFSESKMKELEQVIDNKLQAIEIKEIRAASETISKLQKNKEVAICFATGSFLKPATQKLHAIGIKFNPLQLMASNDFYKREEIVKEAIKNAKKFYGVDSFNRIISIGDGIWDLNCANNLGIDFIGIGNRNKSILIEN